MKLKQKRTKSTQKLWYILQPFFIYLVAKTLAMLILSEACNLFLSEELRIALASPVNAAASIIGVSFIMKDFLIEVAITGEIDIDAPGYIRFFKWIINGIKQNMKKVYALALCMALAIASSLALNIFVELGHVSSEKYENVETIQYGVPLWVGIILYGIISPWVEEIVFRGLLYNRMKRYYNVIPCILVTSIMFGGFHANLPQFIYGTLMGIIIGVIYEWTGTFETPVLFHMTANLFVFIMTYVSGMWKSLVTPFYCITFIIASAILLMLIYFLTRKN